AFLDVVDIEEELHFAGRLAELRDVINKILLHGIREIAQTDPNHLVIPPDDWHIVLLHRVFAHPLVDFGIGRARADKFPELHRVEAGKFPEKGAQPARIEVVFAVDAEQISTGFIQHSCRDDKAAKRFTRTAWWSFSQVARERLQFFFIHKRDRTFSISCRRMARLPRSGKPFSLSHRRTDGLASNLSPKSGVNQPEEATGASSVH